jgi:hypothetical protein
MITNSLKSPKRLKTMKHHLDKSIILTDIEEKICDLLVQVTVYLKETYPDKPKVTLRIAGGWVRDKVQ